MSRKHFEKDALITSIELVNEHNGKIVKHLMEFDEVTIETRLVNSDGEISTWGQEVRLSADGNGGSLFLWASPFTSARLRKMADALDQAKAEAEQYKDQIKV